MRNRTVWLIAAVIFYAAWAVSPALAHALLLRSTPEANAVLTKSPPQVELLFSEPLEGTLSKIKVYDSNHIVVDSGDSNVDPSNSERMTVSLPPLRDGVYIVSWQVDSKIDGHPTAGSFPFAVGNINPSALPAEQEASNTNLPISALIAKWLLLASCALIGGQYFSLIFVWEPALRSEDAESELSNRLQKNWENIYWVGLLGLILACALGILAQAGQASGHELAAPWTKETVQVLMETRLGVIWLARILLALTGLWLIRSRPTNWKPIARFGIGLISLLSISLSSHAATELHPALPVFNDWLHLVGMAIWFGGLAHLISGLAILQRTQGQLRNQIVSKATTQFTLLALPSVIMVGLTGLFSAGLRVGTFSALFDTAYGNALVVKQGFVLGLLIIAAINFLVLSPAIQRDNEQKVPDSGFIQRFRKTVLLEVILACGLLGSVSVLTYLPPAVTLPPQTTLSGTTKADDLKIALSISPGLIGQNDFKVELSPQQANQSVTAVILTFIPVQSNIPPSEIQLTDSGNGVFTASGSHLAFAGRWLVQVTVRREKKFDAIVSFDFNLPKPGAADAKEFSIIPLISKVMIALIVLLLGLNLFIRKE